MISLAFLLLILFIPKNALASTFTLPPPNQTITSITDKNYTLTINPLYDNLGGLSLFLNSPINTTNVIIDFSIKSPAQEIFSNTYTLDNFSGSQIFPIGFPKIGDSKNNTYTVNIFIKSDLPINIIETKNNLCLSQIYENNIIKTTILEIYSKFSSDWLFSTAFLICLTITIALLLA